MTLPVACAILIPRRDGYAGADGFAATGLPAGEEILYRFAENALSQCLIAESSAPDERGLIF